MLEKLNNYCMAIAAESRRTEKIKLLKTYLDDTDFLKLVQFVYDPYITTGLKQKKIEKELPNKAKEYNTYNKTLFELLEYLKEHNTGTAQDSWVVRCFIDSHLVYKDFIISVVTKTLTLGVDAKTINAARPSTIKQFSVQLANKYFDKPEYVEGKDFAITTKIDGGRIIALKENGQVSFYTRAGQKYEGLVDLEREMLEKLPDGLCLDGEITILDNKGIPSKEAYKRAMKITRSDGEKHGLKMVCFDCMLAEEFRAQRCDRVWEARRQMLANVMARAVGGLTYFEPLPVLYAGQDTSMITKLLDEAIANQEEGVMINLTLAPYEFKRTNYLLKCKKMNTVDLQIVDFEEGSGRLAGTLGAILVRYKDGNVVKVGSGFSDDLRDQIWGHRACHLGKIVEIQYFEETTNADGGISLRFPVFKDFRLDKTEADY